jgi:general secretion pathway protein E
MIIVTGPTGSGKTTTLAASLAEINDATRKVLTIEDPIEYQIPGINQTQVHPAIG